MNNKKQYTTPVCEAIRFSAESDVCTYNFGSGYVNQWSQGRDEGEWENTNSIWGDMEEDDE